MICLYGIPIVLLISVQIADLLELLKDPNDDNVDFVEVYGRPMYKISNLQGKPYDLMRLGYPDDDDAYYEIEYTGGEVCDQTLG